MPTAKVRYGVHPGVEMVAKWIATLKAKTGHSLDEWLALIERDGPATEKDRRAWLKEHHGLPTNSAWWLAERSTGKGGDEDSPEAYLKAAARYVDEMFDGAKAALRPLSEELLAISYALGKDVKACPCKTIIPIYRNHVIAQIKPTTHTRIDFGLSLGSTPASGKLIDTGGFAKKDRITHRIAVSSAADIDAELKRWLREAYTRDA